jgi:hypothetical protein
MTGTVVVLSENRRNRRGPKYGGLEIALTHLQAYEFHHAQTASEEASALASQP